MFPAKQLELQARLHKLCTGLPESLLNKLCELEEDLPSDDVDLVMALEASQL